MPQQYRHEKTRKSTERKENFHKIPPTAIHIRTFSTTAGNSSLTAVLYALYPNRSLPSWQTTSKTTSLDQKSHGLGFVLGRFVFLRFAPLNG
jgi:hypothetical protein